MYIEVKELDYVYAKGTPLAKQALKNISLQIEKGEIIGIIGQTGSGKSTLVQHLNGLIRHQKGQISIDGFSLAKGSLRSLRQRIGFVFQYPEHQLFEETVFDDISFSLKNAGITDKEVIRAKVKEVMAVVRLDFHQLAYKSPFSISGGEKRRVALAGVLISHPEILILDEPTAGLDPAGRKELINIIKSLHRELNITVIIISHNMEEISQLASKLFVMNRGNLIMEGIPKDIFLQKETLKGVGLDVPQTVNLMMEIKEKCFDVPVVISLEEVEEVLFNILKSNGTN